MTTHQLIGVYLREASVNAFYTWLQGVGVNAHRNTVVRCISEKTITFMGPTICKQHPPPPTTTTTPPVLAPLVESPSEEQQDQQPVAPGNNKAKNARKRAQKKAKKLETRGLL